MPLDSELRQFDAQTLAPLGEEAVSRETTGLGLALDGGVLITEDGAEFELYGGRV